MKKKNLKILNRALLVAMALSAIETNVLAVGNVTVVFDDQLKQDKGVSITVKKKQANIVLVSEGLTAENHKMFIPRSTFLNAGVARKEECEISAVLNGVLFRGDYDYMEPTKLTVDFLYIPEGPDVEYSITALPKGGKDILKPFVRRLT